MAETFQVLLHTFCSKFGHDECLMLVHDYDTCSS